MSINWAVVTLFFCLVSQCEKQKKGRGLMNSEHEMVGPLYLAVKNGVSLVFNENETRLERIILTNNKLSELLMNRVCSCDSIFSVREVVLITRSKFYTEVPITCLKQASSNDIHVRVASPLLEKDKEINLNQLTSYEFLVSEDQIISKEKLYTLKQVMDEQKKERKEKQKKKKIYYAKAKGIEEKKRRE